MHQSKAHYFDRGLNASVSIHFPTLRRHENNGFRDVSLGKLGQKTRDRCATMHFSPQRDVMMHSRPQRDVVMHLLSCNYSGCIKLNTDICGEIKSRHETVQLEKCEILYAFQSFRCVYVLHNILRNIALFTFIPVKILFF